jgi:hypothetical protein
MLAGLGMAETTPGPLIMVLQFVGFDVLAPQIHFGPVRATAEQRAHWVTETVRDLDSAGAPDLEYRLRGGGGPALVLAKCPRLDGHFLGDPLLRQARNPLGAEILGTLRGVMSAVRASHGGGLLARARSVAKIGTVMARASLAAATMCWSRFASHHHLD